MITLIFGIFRQFSWRSRRATFKDISGIEVIIQPQELALGLPHLAVLLQDLVLF